MKIWLTILGVMMVITLKRSDTEIILKSITLETKGLKIF